MWSQENSWPQIQQHHFPTTCYLLLSCWKLYLEKCNKLLCVLWDYPQKLNNNKHNTVFVLLSMMDESYFSKENIYTDSHLSSTLIVIICYNRLNLFSLRFDLISFDFIWHWLRSQEASGAWSRLAHTERTLWMQTLTWLLGSFHLWGFRSFTESVWSLSGRIEASEDKPGPDRGLSVNRYISETMQRAAHVPFLDSIATLLQIIHYFIVLFIIYTAKQ